MSFTNLYVLVEFYEESKFCVLHLKDAVTEKTAPYFKDGDNLSTWDPKQNIESKFGDKVFPARLIQFGLNKKAMDSLVDELISGSLDPKEVDVIQKEVNEKRKRGDISEKTGDEKKCNIKKRRKETQQRIVDFVKNTSLTVADEKPCQKCLIYRSKIEMLIQENASRDKQLEEEKQVSSALKEKYSNLKRKYKELKKSFKNKENKPAGEIENELTVIGPSVAVDTYKLSLCRNQDYSKFTGDLLDVIFGPEVLGTSVLKGITGCKKISVLNPDVVNDVQMYVSKKFNVHISRVRNAIRQKLNVCHKAYKEMYGDLRNETLSV